ncbi:MAG: pilus assembly protein PilP [Halieaceae bacterium]
MMWTERLPSLKRLITLPIALLLSGCGGSDVSDLERFVSDKTDRPGGMIEPIPTFAAYEAFGYSSQGMRSPFDRPVEVVQLAALRLRSSVAPDRARAREFLEQFPIDSLILVGKLKRQGIEWALLRDPSGGIHRIREGNYVGPDHGKVVDVGDNYVAIMEIVTDGTADGWVERPRTLEIGAQ